MFIIERIISFIAPHQCLGCGLEGSLLCELCSYEQLESVPSRCYRCLKRSNDSAICNTCKRNSSLRHVWVGTEYGGIAKKLVRALKYERAKAAILPMASQLADVLPYLSKDTIITNIPTATSRQRQRGYDQSELLAKEVAKLKDIEFCSLLDRVGQTRQVGSTRKQRFAQAEIMFRIRTGPEHKVLIIDDILTTGASLEAAATLLKNAGATEVNAAVFAQKH